MFRRGKTKTAKAFKEDDSLSLINSSSGEDAANNNNTGKRRFKKLLGPSKTKSKSSISSGENDIVGGVIHSKSSVPSSNAVANNSGTPANKQSKQSTGLSGQKAALEEEMSPRSKLDPPGTIKKSNVSKSKSNSNNNIKNNKTNNSPNRQSTAAVASTSLPQTTSASATTATSLFQNTKSNPQRHHGETSSFASSAESETTTSQTITSQTITSQSITSTSQNKNSAGGGGGGVAARRKNQHNNMMIMMHPGNGADGFGSISAGDGTKNNNNGMAMMTRSGWSITSNASSAMNSENYIQSLDDMPAGNAFRAGKGFPVLNAQSDGRIRSALSRNFGRNDLPPTFHKKWSVRASEPIWDEVDGRYKYKINLTKNSSVTREYSNTTRSANGVGNDDGNTCAGSQPQSSSRAQSFNSATTTRSLQDFVWLEQALRAEYHGALLAPLISLALYFESNLDSSTATSTADIRDDVSLVSQSTISEVSKSQILDNGNVTSRSLMILGEKMDRNEIVDKLVLENWLSDILNGVRGHGEVLLHNRIDVVDSEAMETFLFRHSEPLKGVSPRKMGNGYINPCRVSNLGSPFKLFSIMGGDEGGCNNSLFDNFLFSCGVFDGNENRDSKSQNEVRHTGNGLGSMMCSSGATGVPGIRHSSSNLSEPESDFLVLQACSSNIATHSELLEAERDLIASYIKYSSVAMAKVNVLVKDEAYVGQCWKRFAISLSNLFSVEKDLETAHIGDQIKSNKKKQPFRKLRKSAVDDGLRIIARGKMDRAKPSLQTLSTMLNAYYGDLNSVVPAFKEYTDAINQLHQLDEVRSTNQQKSSKQRQNGHQPAGNDWQSQFEQLKTMTSTRLIDITKQITGVSTQTAQTTVTSDSDPVTDEEIHSLNPTQASALQSRVLGNEKMLKFSITLLCRATPLRTARMAWWNFKTEAKQASNVHAAATSLRQTLSIDADTAIAMKERRYDEDEKRDHETELDVVKRIIDLGSHKADDPYYADSFDMETMRQNALVLAAERVGRWNAETALAILQAAGVEDAEVKMDETSRELRHVRKYAISLRENVERCREAVEALADTFIRDSEDGVQISRSRRDYWAAISTVFSGRISPDGLGAGIGTPSTRVLSSVGIDISDRGGWLGHSDDAFDNRNQQRRRCGEAARHYLKKRDNQANILISRVLKLLKDYERRLEGIESFVYMHCVGIQLEKHWSKARSKALSAWDRRTEISTAINVATRKKIHKLVQELKVKLDSLPQVSHTTVIKAKESHLASKTLKADLHKLANLRFGRAQEVSTERVIAIMSLWAKHEESVAIEEVKAIGVAIQEVECSVQSTDVDVAIDRYSLVHDNRGLHPEGRVPSEGRTLLI